MPRKLIGCGNDFFDFEKRFNANLYVVRFHTLEKVGLCRVCDVKLC